MRKPKVFLICASVVCLTLAALVAPASARFWSNGHRPTEFEARQQRPTRSVPELVIEQTRFDFGKAFAGETLPHVFPVRNAGTEPLTLALTDKLPVPRVGSFVPRGDAWAPHVARYSSVLRPAAAAPG